MIISFITHVHVTVIDKTRQDKTDISITNFKKAGYTKFSQCLTKPHTPSRTGFMKEKSINLLK